MSDDMIRICVNASVGTAGLTSLISSLSHFYLGIFWVVPTVELLQCVVEVFLWLFAVRTGRYRDVFPIQLLVAFTGMSLALVIGGGDFLTNCFWIALISPICLVAGYRRMGVSLFFVSIFQLFLYHSLHSSGFSNQQEIFFLDAVLYTIAMVVMVALVKMRQDKLHIQIAENKVSIEKLQKEKHRHLIQMNHELRNPLAAMVACIGSLQDLQRKGLSSAYENNTAAIVETLHTSSCHMLAVLNDVLEVDRMEMGAAEQLPNNPFSIRQLVQEVSSMFGALARSAGNEIRIRFAEGLADQWQGPSKQIRQVFINLIANAIKYAPGTTISVSVLEHSGYLIFQVADNGPGFSSESVRVFTDPDSASMNTSGVGGLGLKICKLIVEQNMRGTIQLQSNPANGTIFVIRLPLSKFDGPISTVSQSDAPDPTIKIHQVFGTPDGFLTGKELLLAEDDERVGKALTSALEGVGLKVTLVSTSQDAMEAINTGRQFDLALIDYDLGNCSHKDGIGLVRDLKKAGIKTVTGHTATYSPQLHSRWKEAGVSAIVCKPANISEILRVLTNCYQSNHSPDVVAVN